MSGYTLSVDYGTTCSVGVVSSGAGVEVLELGRSRYVPSLVLLGEDGRLVVGEAAVRQAALWPERVCATPKRFVGNPAILLGDSPVPVADAIAAVLAMLAGEAARRFGGAAPERLLLTHPAVWAEERRGVLRQAAGAAGLGEPELVSEPVAAAAHYANGSLASGDHVAVYDLGGGTFDAAVLRRTEGGGFEVAGRPGGDAELGGEDFDDQLRDLVEQRGAEIDPEGFEAAREAGRGGDRINFRREVRNAKESLSDYDTYTLSVPGVHDPVRVTRRELEQLLAPHIRRTVSLLASTIADAGLAPSDLAAIYLTGGSSRIPMVSTLIAQELELIPQTQDDPKAVVALGAVVAGASSLPVEQSFEGEREVEIRSGHAHQGAQHGELTLTTRRLAWKEHSGWVEGFDIQLEAISQIRAPTGRPGSGYPRQINVSLKDGSQVRVEVEPQLRDSWVTAIEEAVRNAATGEARGVDQPPPVRPMEAAAISETPPATPMVDATETVIKQARDALYWPGLDAPREEIRGTLTLTDQRLMFEQSRQDSWLDDPDIPLAHISGLSPHGQSEIWIWFELSRKRARELRVPRKSYEKFWVRPDEHKAWFHAIAEARQRAMHEMTS
jgi:actin-like ATPase involved in cell morphogenesis